jgi:tetratricopeptide (TPR) repeat protein
MTRRFPSASTARLLSAPLALLVALPVGALERLPPPENWPNAGLLAQVKAEIPTEILALEKKASELYGRGEPQQALALIQQVMVWVNANLPRNAPYRARSQTWMGQLLSAVGRRQEALAPTEEAVKIRRELAKTNSAFLNDLAASLTNLGNNYSDLGRRQEALTTSEEAVKVVRVLAKTNPAFQGDLAGTLSNLGIRYSYLGRRHEALAPTEEAAKILRDLAKTNPTYLPGLAMALGNLGNRLDDLGRRQEALAPTEEALKMFRELAKTKTIYLPNLAMALSNMGTLTNNNSDLGRRLEALATLKEAAKIFRDLAKTNPAFQGELAGTLSNLGIHYSYLGRRQEALATSKEAAKIFRELAKTNPAVKPNLAISLHGLGAHYSNLGRRQEALALTEEAVMIYRELAKTNPAFLGDLAASLNNLGYFQLELGQPEITRNAYEEALKLLRPLAASNLAFQENLQLTQKNLDELNRKEGIRTGAKQVLPATNVSYLPQGDPLTSVKRSVVLLWPTFSGKNAGVGLLGTGFVVRRQGDRAWIVTALHVVRDLESNALATKVEAELFTGPLPAGVVAPRAEVLLSQGPALPASGDEPIVLEVRGLPPDIQALPLATTPAQGVLMVVGHPSKPGPWTVVSYPLLKTTDQALLLDGGLDPGASGSPVLSASRQVVGVVYDSPEVTKSRPIPQVWAFPVKALKAKMAP